MTCRWRSALEGGGVGGERGGVGNEVEGSEGMGWDVREWSGG